MIQQAAAGARSAPAGLLLRAGKPADEFDHIVKSSAGIPDAEIDATLREAAAVRALLDAWRDSGAAQGSMP